MATIRVTGYPPIGFAVSMTAKGWKHALRLARMLRGGGWRVEATRGEV